MYMYSDITTVVHNLFRPRATYRYLKPFRGQTSATTPLCPMNTIMLNFMKMPCTVKHKVNLKSYRERDSLLLHYFYITAMLELFPMTTGNKSEMVHI